MKAANLFYGCKDSFHVTSEAFAIFEGNVDKLFLILLLKYIHDHEY